LFLMTLQILEHNQWDAIRWNDCTLSQNITNFCPFPITRSCKTWKNWQQSFHSSLATKNLPFFVFNCNYRASSTTLDASTRFVNILTFSRTMMVFTL
jgi:hypothetical protein